MTWRSPDTYHPAGHGRGTATFKFYEGRDNLHLGPGRAQLTDFVVPRDMDR